MKSKTQIKTLTAVVIVISLLLGGLTGGAIGALSASFFRDIVPSFKTEKGQETDEEVNPQKKLETTGGEVKIVDLETQTVAVVEQSLPSVVSIIATQELESLPRSQFFDDFFFGSPFFNFGPFPDQPEPRQPEEPKKEKQQVSSGSGFIVSADGLVITNRHVVDNTKAEYTVVLNSGKTYKAEVVDRDSIQDLAVVSIKPVLGEKVKFFPLKLGDSQTVKLGQTVIAIGNTLGEFRNTVTRGIVSGINRTITAGGVGFGSELIEGALQTDAAISSGNSGGPLLNLKGEVIGVNTAVSSQGENIGFALPVNAVKQILKSIEKYGKIVRPFLGVRYILLNEEVAKKNNMKIKEGALVTRGQTREELAVIPGSPADKAGIRENDIITAVNSLPITEDQSLQGILSRYQIDDTVVVKIYRAGKYLEKSIKLENRGEFGK